MNRTLSIILAVVGFSASGVMYFLGSQNSALSELMDFFYYPLPLGAYGLISAFKRAK